MNAGPQTPLEALSVDLDLSYCTSELVIARDQDLCKGAIFSYFFVRNCAGQSKIMQNLVRSKTIAVTGNGGRCTAGAGPGRDLLYDARPPTPKRGTGIPTRGPRAIPATPTPPLPTPPPPAAPPPSPPTPPPPLPLPTTLPHRATTPRARAAPAYGMAATGRSRPIPHLPPGATPPVPGTVFPLATTSTPKGPPGPNPTRDSHSTHTTSRCRDRTPTWLLTTQLNCSTGNE